MPIKTRMQRFIMNARAILTVLAILFAMGAGGGHKDFRESYRQNYEHTVIDMLLWAVPLWSAWRIARHPSDKDDAWDRKNGWTVAIWSTLGAVLSLVVFLYRTSDSDYW